MKITKVFLTAVIAAALMSTSCSSDSNDDMNGMDSENETMHMDHDHDGDHHDGAHHDGDHHNGEHHDGDHDMNGAGDDNMTDETHADGVHESSKLVEHEEVKLTLLPPAITESLKKDEYLDVKVERAFVIEEDGVKTYEIITKKGGVETKMLFNEKGIRLDR